MNESLWLPVATASSTSEAVERAALIPPNAPLDLPCPPEQLSIRAKRNLETASRVLRRVLKGFPEPPRPSLPTRYSFQSPAVIQRCTSGREPSSCDPLQVSTRRVEGLGRNNHKNVDVQNRVLHGTPVPVEDDANAPAANANQPLSSVSPRAENRLSQADLTFVSALTDWARDSTHTEPPPSAIQTVASSVDPETLLPVAVPASLPTEVASTLILAIVPLCGARVASALVTKIILPRICALTTPAHRDFMKAIVSLAEAHWRACISLFCVLGQDCRDSGISGPVAEVLTRVSNSLNSEAAKQALIICSAGRWREDGVRVIEALLAKCKSEPSVGATLIKGLESNIHGMESSLRFGKLLFTAVKDVPDIAENHAETARSVASRSTVFLGKRAYALLTL